METLTRSLDPMWEWVLDERPREDGFGSLFACRCWGGREVDDDDLTIEGHLGRTFDDIFVDYIEDPVTKKAPPVNMQPPDVQVPDFMMTQKKPWIKRIICKKSQSPLDIVPLTKAMSFKKARLDLVPLAKAMSFNRKRSFSIRRRKDNFFLS